MFPDLESKTLFKPDRPKDPSGIFHKREIMQYADRFFLDIFDPPKKIDQFSKRLWIELDRQGIHGKVSPIKVHLDRSAFHRGQGGWRLINLPASGGDIHFQPVGEKDDGGSTFSMRPN